jgi:DNA phosphorothioation-associated DGQHR protein 1
MTDTNYELEGTQRGITTERLRAIAAYIDRYDSAFPNSVILAANYREEDGTIEEDETKRWVLSEAAGCESYVLTIPTGAKLAAIIDGQHRLFAFKYSSSDRLQTQLVCSVLLDLPKPFQAQLFATINSTQRPVDKSLTYELFGYNIVEESASKWGPDKLAVFLARKLNVDPASALRGRIIVAPENDFSFTRNGGSESWRVSMATVVEGIARLISSNPKRDADELLTPTPKSREALRDSDRVDSSVFRDAYLDSNDQLIYRTVLNFVGAADKALWSKAREGSFITKTVGIQALFDVLRKLCKTALEKKDVRLDFFVEELSRASDIDFADAVFRNASGSGRIYIRRIIEARIGLIDPATLPVADQQKFFP